MDAPVPGHYWKTPFVWEAGCELPPEVPALRFEPADDAWLRGATGAVMASSLDESDQATVQQIGLANAVAEVFDWAQRHFSHQPAWWRAALDHSGQRVGFVLPTQFLAEARWKDGRPQGTILYMGVLPEFRGKGHALELIREATRLLISADCWRVFCDTGTSNKPMVTAFRNAGYQERSPWQRPLV